MKLAKIDEPCMPKGTIMCFPQAEPPAGWELMHEKPKGEIPADWQGRPVITCQKL